MMGENYEELTKILSCTFIYHVGEEKTECYHSQWIC